MPQPLVLAAYVLLPVTVCAQASKPGTDWAPTSLSAMALAQHADQKLHTMDNTLLEYLYQFRVSTGRGNFALMAAIKNQKQFRVEYPVVGKREMDGMWSEAYVANKGRLAFLSEKNPGGKPIFKSLPQSRQLPTNLVDAWFMKNVQCVLLAVGSNANPFEQLVREASSSPGYQVKAETRTVPIYGKSIVQYRIAVSRTPKAEKKQGSLLYEIVIDSLYWLPITMSNFSDHGKAKYGTEMFGTIWRQDVPANKYPADSFNQRVPHIVTRVQH